MVGCCFLLSGFAALVYETAWLREFAILFGTSEIALGIVLSTYMGGLALGAFVMARMQHRVTRPLRFYAMLEFGIAGSALAVPTILHAVRALQIALFQSPDSPPPAAEASQFLLTFLGAAAATLLPTAMMGATLPMLAKHLVSRNEDLGPRLSALYALNTLGAVLGTLAAAYVLLPWVGLRQTIYVGVAINVGIFLVVWFGLKVPDSLVRKSAPSEKPPESTDAKPSQAGAADSESRPRWILILIALSGGIAFGYEVLFSRMLGHVLGGSLFAFASMLASFLTGITLGAGLSTWITQRASTARVWFVLAQCLVALLSLASWHALEFFCNTMTQSPDFSLPRPLIAMGVLLPPAIAIGLTLPLAIRIHAQSANDAPTSSAQVYAWNTCGGVVGAIAVGQWVLPACNYEGTALLLMVASLLIACIAWLASELPKQHAAAMIIVMVALVVAFPRQPDRLLRVSPFSSVEQRGDLVYVRAGRSATVTVFDDLGSLHLRSGGLPEARITPRGTLARPNGASPWLGALPCLVRPDSKNMLIVGLGAGVAAVHTTDALESIDVFELEPAMVDANRQFGSRRPSDPIVDPRVRIILNDGRSGLALTSKRYDIIASQPSHPWTAGASHLYTHEFARLAQQHLNENGVFVQWMDMSYLSRDLFRSLGATLLDVFPEVKVFRPNPSSLFFLCANKTWRLPCEFPSNLSSRDQDRFEKLGCSTIEDLHAILALDRTDLESACQGATITTDNNNRLALRRFGGDRNASAQEGGAQAIVPWIGKHQIGWDAYVDRYGCVAHDLGYVFRRKIHRGSLDPKQLETPPLADDAERAKLEGFAAIQQQNYKLASSRFRKALSLKTDSDVLFAIYLIEREKASFDPKTFIEKYPRPFGDASDDRQRRHLVW